MKEVSKDQFKETYFKLGGGDATGWGLEYWNHHFEDDDKNKGMKYCVEEPETPQHTRMMIVADFGAHEYRLFFMTEESQDSLYDFPGKD
jgi:hypothetical protein